MVEKKQKRRELLEIRNSIPEQERAKKSRFIFMQLKELPEWKNAEVVFTYVSFGSEVDTILLIEECFKAGKKVAVPKVLSKTEMEFYYITSIEGVKAGVWGILEPEAVEENRADVSKLPSQTKLLMIMPGLGFDREGHRLGYGGGYYDRYLEKYGVERFWKIGLAFEEQMQDKVVSEEYDVRVDGVCFE